MTRSRRPSVRPAPPAPATAIAASADDLGMLRSSHRSLAMKHAAVIALAMVAMIAIPILPALVRGSDLSPLRFVLPPLALSLFFLLRTPLCFRDVHVHLHARGVVVDRAGTRTALLFEDVDEVWLELARPAGTFGMVVATEGVRLVERSGKVHSIPAGLREGADIVRWIERHCSLPLLKQARGAFAAGERLTFGKVSLDQGGIAVRGADCRWADLRVVRVQPGRIALFRRQTVVPWRTIALDEVPHPSVLLALVERAAPKVERDDPLARLMDERED